LVAQRPLGRDTHFWFRVTGFDAAPIGPLQRALGALDADGALLHRRGLSTTHPGLAYVGLEWQRSFASATIRGVSRDADYVVRRLRMLDRTT
jgi:hypothetical protein